MAQQPGPGPPPACPRVHERRSDEYGSTAAALCLTALLVAMFPASVNAARRQVAIGGKPATPLWFRTIVQVIFIAALLWAAS